MTGCCFPFNWTRNSGKRRVRKTTSTFNFHGSGVITMTMTTISCVMMVMMSLRFRWIETFVNSSVGCSDYMQTIGLIGKDLEEVGRELRICLEELRRTTKSFNDDRQCLDRDSNRGTARIWDECHRYAKHFGNSMEENSYWETSTCSCSLSHDIPLPLWNSKVHYRVRKYQLTHVPVRIRKRGEVTLSVLKDAPSYLSVGSEWVRE